MGPCEDLRHEGLFLGLPGRKLDPESRAKGDQRPEQQLVIGDNDGQHGKDGREHGIDALFLDGEGEIGADPRQFDRRVADRDRLGCDDEEPAARHRHHHVPDQPRHREGRFQLPEPLPPREAETTRDFDQIARHAAQRLIEGKGHIPGLRGEDREDGGAFGAQHRSGKKPKKKRHREREKPEDRHRLQDVEQRDEDEIRAPAFGGERRIGECEDERGGNGREHSQGRAQGVIGQEPIVERNDRRFGSGQRKRHSMRNLSDCDEGGENQRKCKEVILVGQRLAAKRSEGDELRQHGGLSR